VNPGDSGSSTHSATKGEIMSAKAAVHVAVQHALLHDGKKYDATQVMNVNPYDYVTPDMMRDFLLDVAQELATDTPSIILRVDSLDLGKCMTSNVGNLETYIYVSLPRIA
jgi:hypothetical protein